MSTYAERQAYRDAHPNVIVDATSAYDPATGQTSNPFTAGGSTAANTAASAQPANNAAAQLGAIQQSILNAIGSGNKAAADQLAHQFDQTFGLDTKKFQEQVRQYNQNFTLAQAGITGQYNGQQTEAGREFDVTHGENARQFDVTAKQNALDNANKTALGVLTLTAGLHSDPFRQLSTMYAANGVDGIRNAVNGLNGQVGGLPGAFTAPGAAGNTANWGGLMGQFSNAPQTQQQMNQVLGSFPSANQVVARTYNAAPQNVKEFTTSGLSANNGLSQQANDQAIQNTLPKFTAPSFGLATV